MNTTLQRINTNDCVPSNGNTVPVRVNISKVPQDISPASTDIRRAETGSQETHAVVRARKAFQREYQKARDHLKRADRDLGETAAVLAASLTTVTAVEAVINIAVDKIGFPREFLRSAFDVYIGIFALILVWGLLRSKSAMSRRASAEKDLDQAQRGILEFFPDNQLPKFDE